MKTKTRRIIGSILIWTGLAIIAAINIYILQNQTFSGITVGVMHNLAIINLVCVAAMMFGGLWGMR